MPSTRLVLLVGVCFLRKLVDPSDQEMRSIAEGAGAVLLEASSQPGVLSAAAQAGPWGGGDWMIQAGGTVEPTSVGSVRSGHTRLRTGTSASHTSCWTPDLAAQLARDGSFRLEDVRTVVRCTRGLEDAEPKRGLPDALRMVATGLRGHAGAATIPMALDKALERGELVPGDIALLVGGSGGQRCAAALRLTRQPAYRC
jgi:3-oxoacyl-[acyl-carrier-protein] synthase-3